LIPFNYNEYSSLLLVVVAPAMLYAGLLLWRGRRQDSLSDQIVGTLVFLFSLQSIAWMLGFAGYYDQSAKTIFMFYFPWKHAFFYGPLVYLFFRSLTERDFLLWRRPNWYHLIPGFLLLSLELITILHDFVIVRVHTLDVTPNEIDEQAGVWLNWAPDFLYLPIEVLTYVSLLGYCAYTLHLYRRYRSYLRTNFSNDELIHLRWLRNFLAFFLFLIIATPIIDSLADSFAGVTIYEFNWYSYLLYGLIACYLGFNAYGNDQQAYRKIAFGKPTSLADNEARPRIRHGKAEVTTRVKAELPDHSELFAIIESTIAEQELYLEPTLSLQELADAIGQPAPEVSNAINRATETNFNFYINAKRVASVQEKLVDPAYGHYSLLGIGLEAGFSSKATFNRAFKLHTGQTPREYQKSQINE
jgi:AraC-like DNA-binding protein